MARKIRFPLKMKNGAEVRTLDELKENFDLESVLGYFTDGKLATWLADRYYDEKAEAVSALSADTPELNAKLCNILEVEYQGDDYVADLEYIQRRNEKLRILSVYTDNKDILNNIDIVALSQDELFDILDEQPDKVYLYGEKFSIPFGAKNVCYIGVNNPVITIDKTKYVFEYNEAGISFKNVRYDDTVNPYVTRGELLYLDNSYKEAFPLVKEAAENGNPRAMYIIAMSYKDGSGVECNKEKCREWLRKANGLNEPLSMMNYAYWCCKDDNEKKMSILSQYSNLLKEMADLGDMLAQFEYGDYLCSYTDDKELGIDYDYKAAIKGYAPAQNRLGNMYYNGNGVEKDYSKAVEWYTKAAEQGNANAQDWIGFFYKNGYGVEKDYSKAVEWYRKAAEQGDDCAQNNLGNMYYNGNGVEKDYAKAVEWYRKAAEQGYAWAQNNLGWMYRNGYGIKQDYKVAVEWYRKAAEQGNADAQNRLGFMYDNGYGLPVDKDKAIEWYRKAAKNGSEKAKNNLSILGVSL